LLNLLGTSLGRSRPGAIGSMRAIDQRRSVAELQRFGADAP